MGANFRSRSLHGLSQHSSQNSSVSEGKRIAEGPTTTFYFRRVTTPSDAGLGPGESGVITLGTLRDTGTMRDFGTVCGVGTTRDIGTTWHWDNA